MKLGCNIWSYHRAVNSKKISQLEWVEKCAKELKLDGVELLDYGFPESVVKGNPPDGDYLKKIKKLCTDLNLEIYLVSSASNFGFVDEKKLKESIEYVKKWIDISYYLGAPATRFFAGHAEPLEDQENGWKSLIKATKICTEYAESKGIVLALENHNGKGFIKTSEDVFKLFNAINSPWLKLCLDTGNFTDLYTSIEKTAHLATVVHAKTFEIKSGVEKKLNYDKIFKIMKKVNFRGYFSIEYEGEDADEFDCMKKSVKYLREMIEKYK
jgi:sugar phosphate isomerase/epimerase